MIKKYIAKLSIILKILLGFPKSLYINLKILPFKDVLKLPVLVSANTRLSGISRNTIKITQSNLSFGMIKIGILEESSGIIEAKENYLGTDGVSTIIFNGKMNMASGGCLKVTSGGSLIIGDGVSFNTHCKVLCKKAVTIGGGVLFGWNVTINDWDGHPVYDKIGTLLNNPRQVTIDNDSWIGANVTLLKGSHIPKGAVVGYGSIVTKSFDTTNAIIVGNPARVVKEEIEWQK